MKGWRIAHSKKKAAQKNKLAFFVLAFILALLLLSQAIKFSQMLFSPWHKSLTITKHKLWDGEFNLNLVIMAKDTYFLSYIPKSQKVIIINIPSNLYLQTPHGFGKWLLSSIYNLGESQKFGGGNLLKGALENQLGLPIDGFLQFSDKYAQEDAQSLVSEIKKSPFLIGILPYLKTDLTPIELFRLKLGFGAVRFDKIRQTDLADALQKEKLADGTDIYLLDEVKADGLLSSLKDPAIQSGNETIAVFNSTDHPLLAQKAARMVTNIGGNVIITQNGQNKLKKSQISGEKSQTFTRIKQIFKADDIIEASNEDLTSSRAQINLFLGEDFFDSL